MSNSEDDAPLIYGVEFQSRALVAEKAETDVSRFMIGTLTLNMPSNQIHIIQLNEDTGAIYSKVYSHGCGEIWHLDWSPSCSDYILSTYQTLIEQDDSLEMQVSLWKTNDTDDNHQLEQQLQISSSDLHSNIKMGIFDTSDKNKMSVVSDNKISLMDISSGSAKAISSLSAQTKGVQQGVGMSKAKYNPEEGVEQLAVLQGTSILGWDPRQNNPAWSIHNSHSILVRDVDYNRNKSGVICSCGDDGCLKFWDIRMTRSCAASPGNPSKALLTSSNPHQHWITSCSINTTHDQLVLTSSTDSTVCLSAVSSVASDPVLSESIDLGDSILKVYDHHEDSVCCVVWSPVDPFTFASLSIDGRLLTSTVPHYHKYKILGI